MTGELRDVFVKYREGNADGLLEASFVSIQVAVCDAVIVLDSIAHDLCCLYQEVQGQIGQFIIRGLVQVLEK
ncbi:hypothetical protein D3C80_1746890 [compost metagenome]